VQSCAPQSTKKPLFLSRGRSSGCPSPANATQPRSATGTSPTVELIDTLCGQQLTRAPVTDSDYLWPACWTTTAAYVGLRA
jgi:hypothetical protein